MSPPRWNGEACHVFKHAEEKACPQCGQAMTEVNVPPDPEAEAMAALHEMCAQLDASPIVPVEVALEELDKPDGGMFKRTAEQEASSAKFKAALDQLMGDYLAKPLTLPRTAWDDADEGQGIYTVYLDGREQWTVVTDDLAGAMDILLARYEDCVRVRYRNIRRLCGTEETH